MASTAPIIKYAFPAFIIFLLLALVTICLLSLRRSGITLVPARTSSDLTGQGVNELVGNVSRALAQVEERAGRLEGELRQLGATARALVDREKLRSARQVFERRQLCDNAWWWWKSLISANNNAKSTIKPRTLAQNAETTMIKQTQITDENNNNKSDIEFKNKAKRTIENYYN